MNKVIFTGNLTKDPEIRYSQNENQTAVGKFSIAVNRRFSKDSEKEADFFNCTAFGKSAEFLEKFFKKGMRITVVGRMQNDNYTNKNGEKVYGMQVIAEELEFGSTKQDSGTLAGGQPVGLYQQQTGAFMPAAQYAKSGMYQQAAAEGTVLYQQGAQQTPGYSGAGAMAVGRMMDSNAEFMNIPEAAVDSLPVM